MIEAIARDLEQAAQVHAAVRADAALIALVAQIAELVAATLRNGGKILFAGNGGSAADCQHLAGELVCRFNFDRSGLAAIALTTDTSILTSIGNDYGFERIFARQIEALGRPGDLLFALSTSGRSANVLQAISAAKANHLFTVGFTGRSGGLMIRQCDLCLCAPSADTPRIQEVHITLGHIICGLVEQALFGTPDGL